MAGAINGINTMASINRSVAQLGSANKASHSETVRHLETVNAKIEDAAHNVIGTAVDLKSRVTEAKGNTINLIA